MESEIDITIALINSKKYDKVIRNNLNKLLTRGEGQNLVEALIRAQEGADFDSTITGAFNLVEELGGFNAPLACCLMVHFLVKTNGTALHDVWDSVCLWLQAEADSSVLNYVENEKELLLKHGLYKFIATDLLGNNENSNRNLN
jgi:hypothetical protein